jgi:hypothetical protein
MKRLLVTGGRDYLDSYQVLRMLVQARDHLGDVGEITLVHGGARGADALAAETAARLGMRVEAHPADWKRHGRAAGMIRNAEMVALGADLCIAFPGGEGTRNCVRRAMDAHIPVWAA